MNEVVTGTGSRVTQNQLSQIVRHWSAAARLQGHHSFASMRIGFLRSAAREGVAST